MLKNKIKKLALIGTFLASGVIPSLVLSIDYDQKNKTKDFIIPNPKVNNLSKMLLYDNKIFNNKDEVLNYYLMQHPEAIGNINVIGDVKKAIVDFDYNILNQRKLKEFNTSLLNPVYRSAAREQTKDFDFARKSKINPAFTTHNYTDGFNNFFDYKNVAKNSFSKHLVPGQIGLQNIYLLDGKQSFYNPLSINDYNSYYINATKSLQNYQANKLNLPNHYQRQYFNKDNQQILSFNQIFQNQALLNLFNNEENKEFDHYLQMENVQNVVNNYDLETISKISNLNQNTANNLSDYNLKLTSLTKDVIQAKNQHKAKLEKDIQNNKAQVNKLNAEIQKLKDNKTKYQDKIDNGESQTIYSDWVTIRVKTDYYNDYGNNISSKNWNQYWDNLSYYALKSMITDEISSDKHLISFDKSRSSFSGIISWPSSWISRTVTQYTGGYGGYQSNPKKITINQLTTAIVKDVTIPYRYNYTNIWDSRSWAYKKNSYLKKISEFQKEINNINSKIQNLNNKINSIKNEIAENRIYIQQSGKPVSFKEIKDINNLSNANNIYSSNLNGLVNRKTISLSYNQFKKIVENDRDANKRLISSNIGNDNSLYLWLSNKRNSNQEALYSVNLQKISDSNIFKLMDKIIDKNNLELIFDFSNLKFSKGIINNIKVYWKLKKQYPKFKNVTSPPQKLNFNQIKSLDINKDYLFFKLQSKIDGFNNPYENTGRLNALKSFLNNYNKNIYEVITYNQLPVLKIVRNNQLTIENVIPYSQNKSKYEIKKLLSIFPNADSLYSQYINNNLEEFKETLKVSHFIKNIQPGFQTAAYYYFLTLKDYIYRTSIIGKLPKELNFKLPEKIDNFNLFANTPVIGKKYWVLNQYIFNGSTLSKAGLDHIGSTNIYKTNDKQQEKLMQEAKATYTKYFNPPLVSHLYDANGKEVVSDSSGYSMYDSLEIIIENARLGIMPDRDLNTVFYGSMYSPIDNVVSNIYVLHYEEQTYYFLDYESLKEYLKSKLAERIKTYVRKVV